MAGLILNKLVVPVSYATRLICHKLHKALSARLHLKYNKYIQPEEWIGGYIKYIITQPYIKSWMYIQIDLHTVHSHKSDTI